MTSHPEFTLEQICKMYQTTPQRLGEMYFENAKVIEKMHQKAVAKGKKVNGYTAEQLEQNTKDYYDLSEWAMKG